MKALWYISSLFVLLLVISCGDQSADQSSDNVGVDTPATKVETTLSDSVFATGSSTEMDSIPLDTAKDIEQDNTNTKKKLAPQNEVKEAPKHSSPDEEEIKKMKEEKAKTKKG